MPNCKGYKDVDFFNQKFKTNTRDPNHYQPVILTRFRLFTQDKTPFGLDDLVGQNPWKDLPKQKAHWTAHAVIRSLDWLSDTGRSQLSADLQMSDMTLELFANRGEIEVLLRGRLSHIPQYMNSDDVPHGLRMQALKRAQVNSTVAAVADQRRSTLVINEERYYVVQSFHIHTFAHSRKFLDQYRVQHFITEICKKHRKSKSKKDPATVEWLVQEYLSMWKDAFRLKTIAGAPPKQCDVLHYLALHIHRLCDWAMHSGPIPNSTWLEFAEQVISARERARELKVAWGTMPIGNDLTPRLAEDQQDVRGFHPEVKPQSFDLPEDLLTMPEAEESLGYPLPGNNISGTNLSGEPDRSGLSSLASLSLQADPIWADVPREMELPNRLSRGLLWKCPCPQPHSSEACLFEIYLRDPSQRVRSWLSEDELLYLAPVNGVPEWDVHSPRLHNILARAICHHYALDHLEGGGIYIQEGHLTRILPNPE